MSDQTDLVAVPSLDDRAASINHHLALAAKAKSRFDDHRLRAGQELIEARNHVPSGEWLEWCRKNFSRSRQDIARVMKLAAADDPEGALEQERAVRREGMAASRAKVTHVGSLELPTIEGEFTVLKTVTEAFAALKPSLDTWPGEDVRRFADMLSDYLHERPGEIEIPPPTAAATITLGADEYTDADEPETLAQKSERADREVVDDDLVDRGGMSEKNDGEWKITAPGKGKNRGNPQRQPLDLAAEAAKIGYPVSPNAAVAA